MDNLVKIKSNAVFFKGHEVALLWESAPKQILKEFKDFLTEEEETPKQDDPRFLGAALHPTDEK